MEAEASSSHAKRRRGEQATVPAAFDSAAGVDLRDFVTRQHAYKTLSQLLVDGPYNEAEAAARRIARRTHQERSKQTALVAPKAANVLLSWIATLGSSRQQTQNGNDHATDSEEEEDTHDMPIEPRLTFNSFYAVYEVCHFMPKMIDDMRALYSADGKLATESSEEVAVTVQALIHASSACRAIKALMDLPKRLINISLNEQEQEAFKLTKSWVEELRTGVVEAMATTSPQQQR